MMERRTSLKPEEKADHQMELDSINLQIESSVEVKQEVELPMALGPMESMNTVDHNIQDLIDIYADLEKAIHKIDGDNSDDANEEQMQKLKKKRYE